MQKTKTDFLVIGSGIAGLNFALEAAQYGEVTILTKKEIAESNTNYAQGGIAAVLDKTDNYQKHITDTLDAGAHHNNLAAVEILVKEGPALVRKLADLGVGFQRDKAGEILLTREGGHSDPRIAFSGDTTGAEIERVLVQKVREHNNIKVLEHTFATDLILNKKSDQSEVHGVYAFNTHTLESRHYQSALTILASGGTGQLFYPHTTNLDIATGDGIAMGLHAGARVKDMEFFQFHPTALFKKGLPSFLLSESLRGEGAYLRNVLGKRFMRNYDEREELAPRDIVARAIGEEEKKGPVYLDMRHFDPQEFKTHFINIFKTLQDYGIHPLRELVPVSPAAHYTMGGLEVDLWGWTGLPYLYAFGEVACTGVHGANRLASNSLLEALVFSHRIVQQLPTLLEKASQKSENFQAMDAPKKFPSICQRQDINQIRKIRDQLTLTMWKGAGIVRVPEKMQKALQKVEALSRKLTQFKCIHTEYFETRNLLIVAREVLQAALARKKSLGAHCIFTKTL